MISASNISVHFTGTYLFENISFLINPRDRIGLTGKNGAGKTTMMRILAGRLQPESGSISKPNGSTTAYLAQELDLSSKLSVREEALLAFKEIGMLEEKIATYSEELAQRTDYESTSYMSLITKLHEANERFDLLGGNNRFGDTEKVLIGLGFDADALDRPMNTFSGGWQMRVELAKLLLSKPDLLLLDEPTNHLDIESIQWLEEFLKTYPGAVMVVSHDRAFLDNITNRTLEIANARIYDYPASFSEYIEMREANIEQQRAAFNNQQRQIDQIERFIRRFRAKSTKARQVQSRIKLLDKIERIEIDELDSASIHFRFPSAPRIGKVVVEATNLGKKYSGRTVLKELDFAILSGEKVAFVGRNGEGKTTLSKIIAAKLEHEGKITIGHNVSIGYYAQNQSELLDGDKTVYDTLNEIAPAELRPRVRAILGSFLFDADDIDKKAKVLSGGEKARLALARLLMHPYNLLVLDEPTNHLDMVSKDILKNALIQYDGTLIIVSHDRDFLQGLTQKVFEFKSQKIRIYAGDVYDFLDARKLESLKQLEIASRKNSTTSLSETPDNKITHEKKRENDRILRKLQTTVKKIEEVITDKESQLELMNAMLACPDSFPDEGVGSEAFFERYQKLKQELDAFMQEWEKAHYELEAFPKSIS